MLSPACCFFNASIHGVGSLSSVRPRKTPSVLRGLVVVSVRVGDLPTRLAATGCHGGCCDVETRSLIRYFVLQIILSHPMSLGLCMGGSRRFVGGWDEMSLVQALRIAGMARTCGHPGRSGDNLGSRSENSPTFLDSLSIFSVGLYVQYSTFMTFKNPKMAQEVCCSVFLMWAHYSMWEHPLHAMSLLATSTHS